MTIPQAVIFDLGKVLLDFDYALAIQTLLPRCAVTPNELHRLINQSPLLLRYESGQLSSRDFFEEVKTASGFRGDFEEFRLLFADIFSPIPEMIQLHQSLRRAGLATFVFSNTNELAVAHIRNRFPFFHQFDGYILSYECGLMKPDPRIYRVVEQVAGHRGADLLYLDDRPENIQTAISLGWQTLLHTSPETTRQALLALQLA